MTETTVIVDEFEYKGIIMTVHKGDISNRYFFKYVYGGKKYSIALDELKKFIKGSYSHATINNTPVDMIEKSVKIQDLLYNLTDLKNRIKKYK
jgi:hypothetical protein